MSTSLPAQNILSLLTSPRVFTCPRCSGCSLCSFRSVSTDAACERPAVSAQPAQAVHTEQLHLLMRRSSQRHVRLSTSVWSLQLGRRLQSHSRNELLSSMWDPELMSEEHQPAQPAFINGPNQTFSIVLVTVFNTSP